MAIKVQKPISQSVFNRRIFTAKTNPDLVAQSKTEMAKNSL
jgi:hypothetical protein